MGSEASSRKRLAMFSIHSDPLASLGSQEAGGQNVYVRYLAEELGKIGWDVDVFTRWDSSHKKQIAAISKHARVIRLNGSPPSYVPKSDLFDFLPQIFDSFLAFNNGDNPYELFHGHYWDGGSIAIQAHRKFGKPFVQTFHSLGITRMETKKKFLKDSAEQEYFTKRLNLENEIIKESSKIICLSAPEKQDLIKLYGCPGEKIEIIPGGVSIKNWHFYGRQKAREYLMIKPEEFVILFVGRFEWRKGISTLINAASLVKKEISPVRVVIVGGKIFGKEKNVKDVKEYERLLGLAKSLRIEDIITFTGSIEQRALVNFYQSANVFVVPSYYEPFGLVALEGMANKVPVIASRVGGLASIIQEGKTGLLFNPRDAKDLKNKILQLHQTKELPNQLSEAAYKEVTTKYSWGDIVKKIDNEYQKILKTETP